MRIEASHAPHKITVVTVGPVPHAMRELSFKPIESRNGTAKAAEDARHTSGTAAHAARHSVPQPVVLHLTGINRLERKVTNVSFLALVSHDLKIEIVDCCAAIERSRRVHFG
jgi:hypothetical protein